jgi:hypothetical protein
LTGALKRSTAGAITQEVWPWATPATPPSMWPMAWLAPIGTPATIGIMLCQTPIWHFSRASRSRGSAFTRGRPSASSSSAQAAMPSQ